MPNKEPQTVRKPTGLARPDARAQRSTHALARALMQLMMEGGGRFEDITVREILERAGVGRTTFYTHFRTKEDVLHSTYEAAFGMYKSLVSQDTNTPPRLFPVTEFAEHVIQSRAFMAALRKTGLVDDMKSQFVGYAADIISCRLRDLDLETVVRPRLAARMLAAALVESIDWWVDHEGIAAGEIDSAFHLLARSLIRSRRYLGAGSVTRDSVRSFVTKR